MADANSNNISTHTFDGDLNTDIRDFHSKSNNWSHARNCITNSSVGDLGSIQNEPANKLCIQAPYTIIGFIYLYEDNWAVYSTNDVDSEVGRFKESTCTYTTVANDPCLNFNRLNLITGVAKQNFDCTWSTYWADQYRNSDRTLNLDRVPYVQTCVLDSNGCKICTNINPLTLDCSQIRLAKPTKFPCVQVQKGNSGGSLFNGSYLATVAYTINNQKVTDYFGISNAQSIFSHENEGGSIDIILSNLDETYDEYELVVISVINQQTVAKKIGNYSTRQTKVSLDVIDNALVSIPLEFLPIHNPISDSSESISELSNSLLRVKPRTKFDFNYQPLANQIITKWVSVEYEAEYYRNGGNNPSFLRDENYALFIQWIYDDGDLSISDYHIPNNAVFNANYLNINSATVTSIGTVGLPDGGIQIAEGMMGYYQTTEKYPDDKPTVWTTLCGKPIRHHKMPEHATHPRVIHYVNNGTSVSGPAIRVLAIKCENIKPPVDNQGNIISNIVGYRILRGSREGNKTIIGKGLINNLIDYNLNDGSGKTGLLPNYPYNDGNVDAYLSATQTSTSPVTGNLQNNTPIQGTVFDAQTFHSPDTQFKKPFLSPDNLKIYCLAQGGTTGQFEFPEKHPKYKFITNALFLAGLVGGIGFSIIKLNGTRRTRYISPSLTFIDSGVEAGGVIGTFGLLNAIPTGGLWGAASGLLGTATTGFTAAGNSSSGQNNALDTLASVNTGGAAPNAYWSALAAATAAGFAPGLDSKYQVDKIPGLFNEMPSLVAVTQGLPLFSAYTNEGYDTIIRFIKNANGFRHAALQYRSHCFYNDYNTVSLPVNINNPVSDANYLGSGFQEFGNTYRVNNLYRSKTVITKTTTPIPPSLNDNTKFTLATSPTTIDYKDPTNTIVNTTAASYYGALKINLGNQYGQIGAIKQIPFGCVQQVTITSPTQQPFVTEVLFGGDTYITRYAERNTMFFFYDWLFNQPDDFEYDYLAHKMLPYPKYWANSDAFELAEFFQSILPNLASFSLPNLPTGKRALDNTGYGNIANHGFFLLKNAYFYLFNSGVRDFYVESEINTFQRDWEDDDIHRFYDNVNYSDTKTLFRVPNIKNLDYYKYDYSLSSGRTFVNFASWATVQPTYYDPILAETCYVNHPRRIIYSLPQSLELIRDNWRVFLANNYRDFRNEVTGVKSLGLTGSLITFKSGSPIQIQGVENLKLGSGTIVTIGDGTLLSQASQNLTNSDAPYEYGSCQNLRSMINTPVGVFWISQNQGKIFTIRQGLLNMAMKEMNWWLIQYLPYQILKDFPTFSVLDNPVMGVGCQSIYDNENMLLYFTKRDFRIKPDFTGTIFYQGGIDFLVNNMLQVKLGDSDYFEDCSWTISYDPKKDAWVSHHDWHPGLLMPAKTTFISIKDNGIWEHNSRCDLFCNYYGVDYPWEIEYPVMTGQQVNILNSIEYLLEVYKFDNNCRDRYLLLKENFDEAVIFNNEQVSGLLKLNVTPDNDPQALVQYPIFNAASIDILYSKIEDRYRFNAFHDMTDDRGEFSTAQRMIWNTAGNGYVKTLNPVNLNYGKDSLQLKRFRGYGCSIFFRKTVCLGNKFLLLITNDKNLESKR